MLRGRLEDQRMLTGRGRYVSDWNLPGQAYGHFLRSDRAHAEIVSIDKQAALDSPGVLAVFTGEDIGALKSLPAALPAKGRGGSELINPGRPARAQERPARRRQGKRCRRAGRAAGSRQCPRQRRARLRIRERGVDG
jgi:CO/xanthine dehydrogenase Mo-binding subunit